MAATFATPSTVIGLGFFLSFYLVIMLKTTISPIFSSFTGKPKCSSKLFFRAFSKVVLQDTPPSARRNASTNLTTLHKGPPTSAYVHLPFCRKRCHYCDFPILALGMSSSSARPSNVYEEGKEDDPRITNYVNLLVREIKATRTDFDTNPNLETVFFGGGTPSLVPPKLVSLILETLSLNFGLSPDAEISMEMDPAEGYAIELYFDPALENQVLKAWNVFARRQISTKLINTESRPHITLFSTSFFDSTRLESVIKNFVSKQEPISISFSTIGSFSSDNNVLFLSPTPSLSLLQLQTQLCDMLKKESVDIGEEYRVDSWVPFCPVALDVPKSRMAEAFSVLRDLKLPVNGYGMEIGLVEFSPVREVFSFPLGNTLES